MTKLLEQYQSPIDPGEKINPLPAYSSYRIQHNGVEKKKERKKNNCEVHSPGA